jgi:hypothetical protein
MNANLEMIVILEVFTKIFFNFAPLTLLMAGAVWVTTKIID